MTHKIGVQAHTLLTSMNVSDCELVILFFRNIQHVENAALYRRCCELAQWSLC